MDPLTLTGLAKIFADFGFPALMVGVMRGFMFKYLHMHKEERIEWRDSALALEKLRDERAKARDDNFRDALHELTVAVQTISARK